MFFMLLKILTDCWYLSVKTDQKIKHLKLHNFLKYMPLKSQRATLYLGQVKSFIHDIHWEYCIVSLQIII